MLRILAVLISLPCNISHYPQLHTYSWFPLILHKWDQTDAKLSNFLNYQTVTILAQNFYRTFLCYCLYIWSVKVIREEFSLDFSFIYWFKGFRILFCGIWSLPNWKTWWSTRQVIRKHHCVQCRVTTTVDVETLTETFLKYAWTWHYFCQMLQCQDFWSIRFQIKGILLYLLYTVTFTGY